MKIRLKQQTSGLIREVKIGFSWTSLFFGFFVPLFRGDFLWFCLCIILNLIGVGIFWFVFPFIYNRIYIKKLMEKGYAPADEFSSSILLQKGWIAKSANFTENRPKSPSYQNAQQIASQPEHTKSYSGQPAQQETGSINDIIQNVLKRHSGSKKAFTADTLPNKSIGLISKGFQPINPSREVILFAGLYTSLFLMKPLGVVITESSLYYRLSSGFMSGSKSGHIALHDINSIKAEHTNSHACYGGGNPGLEITINGKNCGWIQLLFVMSEEDENLLIDLITEINNSGVLLSLRP